MSAIQNIADRFAAGQRLSAADFLELHRGCRLLELGALANARNARLNGEIVWFHQHRLLSVGTVDYIGGDAAGEGPKDISYYVVNRIKDEDLSAITELRLGAFQPDRLSFASLLKILTTLASRYPDKKLRALSARQLWLYSQREGCGIESLAKQLAEIGQIYLDGRGAGLLGVDYGKRPDGFNSELWFKVHRLCHLNGLASDASMEYGLLDSAEQRLAHLEKLRAIQDETNGFLSFMPLAHQYQQPRTGYYQKTSGVDDLKMMALSRLYLDNFSQLHVLWGRVGFDIAQLAMIFGVNSLEGEITQAKPRSRERTFRSLTRREAKAMIKKADRIALQRDGLYRPVKIPDPETLRESSLLSEDTMLYKLDNRLEVGMATYVDAAEQLPLLSLGTLADDFKARPEGAAAPSMKMAAPSFAVYTPSLADPESCATEIATSLSLSSSQGSSLIAVEFGGWKSLERVTLEGVERCLATVKAQFPAAQISLKGMKGLWQLGSPDAVANVCAALGVTVVESSTKESEEDFTRSERLEFHREFHRHGIGTIPLVSLSAPYAGDAQPFWEAFCQDLMALRTLQQESGKVLGIKVLQAPHAFVTPCEYLRAVALTRIICHNVPEVITPFEEIPTINQARARIAHAKKREALKVLPLCGYFGASDIGEPNPLSRNTALIWEELLHAGITPSLRDYHFNLVSRSKRTP